MRGPFDLDIWPTSLFLLKVQYPGCKNDSSQAYEPMRHLIDCWSVIERKKSRHELLVKETEVAEYA
jgi:hypothetical protein